MGTHSCSRGDRGRERGCGRRGGCGPRLGCEWRRGRERSGSAGEGEDAGDDEDGGGSFQAETMGHADAPVTQEGSNSRPKDPTPDRGLQFPRAASLNVSSLGFINDLRERKLSPDSMPGTPLDMDQYTLLFGTARILTEVCDH